MVVMDTLVVCGISKPVTLVTVVVVVLEMALVVVVVIMVRR